MSVPIFSLAASSSDVVVLLGSPLRFFMFGEAEQGTEKPYAVWQQVYGTPENKLAGTPDYDLYGVQVDVYAMSASSAREVAMALRDAVEPEGYIVDWSGESRDFDTRLYRFSFTVEFMTSRG